MIRRRREKVFGPGRAVPLDRNAKARILVYARAWGARHRQPGQHKGPITRAFLEVLEALLWGFHNSRSGCCFPSYEAIAARAECARSTVAEALKALEWAGVLTWQNRITRICDRERDLFGHWASRWRVIRTSNAYVFRDPLQRLEGGPASKSEIRAELRIKRLLILLWHPHAIPTAPWSAPCSNSAAPSKQGGAGDMLDLIEEGAFVATGSGRLQPVSKAAVFREFMAQLDLEEEIAARDAEAALAFLIEQGMVEVAGDTIAVPATLLE